MQVNGRTRLFATIGTPVAQVRLPEVMQAVFESVGVNAVWMPLEVSVDDFPLVLAALRRLKNLGGMTIAIPFKGPIVELADRVSNRARLAGCANLFRVDAGGGTTVDTVDGLGFVLGLRAHGYEPAGTSAWVVGTGGGGSSIAAALCEAGVSRLALTDVDRARASTLADRLRPAFAAIDITTLDAGTPEVDMAINASPMGLKADDPLPFDPSRLPGDPLVCDIIMKPAETRLLAAAAACGLKTHYGRHTLDYQITPYLDFFGIEHDETQVLELVKRLA